MAKQKIVEYYVDNDTRVLTFVLVGIGVIQLTFFIHDLIAIYRSGSQEVETLIISLIISACALIIFAKLAERNVKQSKK